MYEILSMAAKDLRLLLRDKAGAFFAFVFPLVYAVFFGMIFSGVGRSDGTNKLEIVVVDEDRTAESGEFVESLRGVSEINVSVAERAEAEDLVRKGERLAYVVLVEGFGENRDGMFWGQPPKAELGIDPSRQAEVAMLQGILIKCAFERMQEMFTRPEKMAARVDEWMADVHAADDIDPVRKGALLLALPALKTFTQNIAVADGKGDGSAEKTSEATTQAASVDSGEKKKQSVFAGGWQAIDIQTESVMRQRGVQISSYAWTFPQGIIWGVMGCAAAFGISLVTERTNGTLVRLRMAPIASWQILAGKATACFVTTMMVMVALLLLAAFAFGVRPNSVLLMGMAVVSVSLGFVGIMMLLAVAGKTEQSAGGIGWAVLMVMAMIGGGMVPRIFMPGWMQTVSHVSPVKWAIHAMEGALWRGFSLGEMLIPCAILVGIGVVCFAFGVRAFRWTG